MRQEGNLIARLIKEKNWIGLDSYPIDLAGLYEERECQYFIASKVNLGKYDEAIELSKLFLERFPKSISILNLAYLSYSKNNQPGQSVIYLKRILSLDLPSEKREKYLERLGVEQKKKNLNKKKTEIAVTCDTVISLVQTRPVRSKVLFITFWGAQEEFQSIEAMRARDGYAEDFLLSQGFDVISVINKKYACYQNLQLEDFQNVIRPFLEEYQHVFAYGGSGGGYAALFYSVGLNVVPIAYSPRISIDPVCKMKNIYGFGLSHAPLSEMKTYQKAHVFYDPFYFPDSAYVNERASRCYVNATFHQIPFMGHGAFYFSEIGMVKKVVLDLVKNGSIDRSLVRNGRKISKIYHYHLALKLFQRGKIESAIFIALNGLSINSKKATKYDKVDIFNLLLKNLFARGMHYEAGRIFQRFKNEKWFLSKKNKYLNHTGEMISKAGRML